MNNQTVDELNNRNFDECLFSIICLPIPVYFKYSDLSVNMTTFYIFFSCNMNGVRKYLTIVKSDDYTKISDFYDLFLIFKKRKVKTILYGLIPLNENLNKGLKLAFPDITTFISPYEPMNKIYKYYPCKYSSKVFSDIRNIYDSADINEFTIFVETFYSTCSESLFLRDLLAEYFEQVKKYISFDKELRKNIFSFYFLREIYKRTTVISHSKSYFTSTLEFEKELLSLIKSCETRMYCSKKDWIEIINIIYKDKKDLIKCYL